MKSLNVALCFSGQLRAWEKALPTIQKFMNGFDKKPDVFAHIWDFNSTSNAVFKQTGKREDVEVPQEELHRLLEAYKPIKVVIEDKRKSKLIGERLHQKIKAIRDLDVDEDIDGTPYWLGPQYYGIHQAALLKDEHENEGDFYYDAVIRMRFDTFLDDDFIANFFGTYNYKFLEPFTVYNTHVFSTRQHPFVGIGDIFFYADSLTYSIVSDYINNLPHVFDAMDCRDVSPEEYFGFYIRSCYLKFQSMNYLNPSVARPDEYFNILKEHNFEPYSCDV